MTDPLEQLWAQVAHVAQARVGVLEAALAALRAGAPDAAERQAEAEVECHKLIGALDSYGRTGGSALAARAQALLAEPCADDRLDRLAEVVEALRRLVG